jgi:hypothetical protein
MMGQHLRRSFEVGGERPADGVEVVVADDAEAEPGEQLAHRARFERRAQRLAESTEDEPHECSESIEAMDSGHYRQPNGVSAVTVTGPQSTSIVGSHTDF